MKFSVGPNFGGMTPLTFRCHHKFGALDFVETSRVRSRSASSRPASQIVEGDRRLGSRASPIEDVTHGMHRCGSSGVLFSLCRV